MYKTIAIDGACRRNGKPDCVSSGACFIVTQNDDIIQTEALAKVEEQSTSQRGELIGLILALEYLSTLSNIEALILTDSEYIFNTMTKDWINRWLANDWQTAEYQEVKNKDMWQIIYSLKEAVSIPVTFFHIKGHLLSVGLKKSEKLFLEDTTGFMLYQHILQEKRIQPEKLMHAKDLSLENNGFSIADTTWYEFAAMNAVVDTVANLRLTAYEAEKWSKMLQ